MCIPVYYRTPEYHAEIDGQELVGFCGRQEFGEGYAQELRRLLLSTFSGGSVVQEVCINIQVVFRSF